MVSKIKAERRERRISRREKVSEQHDVRFTTSTDKVVAEPYLSPKNDAQAVALRELESGKPVVFLTGSAGTGKSMLAAYRASRMYRAKHIKKILLVRPAVSVGKSIGLLPGEIDEKLAPYFRQTILHLERFLGTSVVEYCLDKKVIEMFPVEYIRGNSFENCIVIAEEVQNFTFEEMEMMLTRLGENCQIIFTGDTKQNDLLGASGLSSTISIIDNMTYSCPDYMSDDDIDELENGVAIVKFTPDDVVRSGLTKSFVKMYFHND